MNTRTMKVLTTVISIVVMILMLGSVVFAANETTPTPGSINANYAGTGKITELGGSIMGIIRTIGVVVAVIILMVLGIKYMMGSAEEKAEYKKTMIPYIIGAVLLFGATTIAGMVYEFADKI